MAHCPVCSEPVDSVFQEPRDRSYRFLRCGGCDLIFTDPMPSPDGGWYEKQTMYIVRDQLMSGSLQWNHQQLLKDRPAAGGRLLDVGCGTGEFLSAAKQAGYQVSGFDFDSQAIETAKKRFHLENLAAGDLFGFQEVHRQEPFQVVTAFEVLEHSPEPGRFMEALSDLTAPGGYLAISVPNRNRWPKFQYDWDLPPNHLTRWSAEALNRLLQKNGFEVLRTGFGWRQGEPWLHQKLQFGLVSRLAKKRTEEPARQNGRSSLRATKTAYQIKSAAIKGLAVPVNLGLGLLGETGMTLYLLARKNHAG